MLKNVVSNGIASRARVYDKQGRPIEQGGKTGTTNQNRTVWFVGITPEYVTVSYIGRDDNKPMYGKITGGSAVAPMWAKYYQTLINKGYYTPGKFEFLENAIETGDLVKQNIDIYTGLLDGPNSKEIVVRKGRLQVESSEKYRNGIASVFGIEGGIGVEENIENSDEVVDGENNENANGETSEGDGLINRLFGE